MRFNALYFPSLHFTPLHFTSLKCTLFRFTSLRFSSLRFTQMHLNALFFSLHSLHLNELCFTCLHLDLHFTSLKCTPLDYPASCTSGQLELTTFAAVNGLFHFLLSMLPNRSQSNSCLCSFIERLQWFTCSALHYRFGAK